MNRPIFTDLAPNTEKDDAQLAFRLLFRPGAWRKGRSIAELEDFMCHYLPIKHAITFESGRTGLMALLEAMELPEGYEVLVQAFTCVAVPNSVIWAGGKPVFVDCLAETFNMDPVEAAAKITPRTKVMIVQHTFGCPADMPALMELAKAHGLWVIEDCAHAIGSEYQGRKTGTWGDAALFSFGRDKAVSSVFGGLIATNRDDWAARLEQTKGDYPYPSGFWVWRQLLHPVVMSLAKRTYSSLGLGRVILALTKKLRILSKAVELQERKGDRASFIGCKMPNALAVLAVHQLKKLDRFNVHRREIAALYAKLLDGTGIGLPGEPADAFHTFIRYTIATPDADRLRAMAKARHIYLGSWYDTPIAPRGVDYAAIGYEIGSCPVAERLARQIVNLPTDIHIGPPEAERIVQIAKTALWIVS